MTGRVPSGMGRVLWVECRWALHSGSRVHRTAPPQTGPSDAPPSGAAGLPSVLHFSNSDPASSLGTTALKFDTSAACDTPAAVAENVTGFGVYVWADLVHNVSVNATARGATDVPLYVCLTLDYTSPSPTWARLAGTALELIPTPTYAVVNPYVNYTLRVLLDSNRTASATTFVYLSAVCPQGPFEQLSTTGMGGGVPHQPPSLPGPPPPPSLKDWAKSFL